MFPALVPAATLTLGLGLASMFGARMRRYWQAKPRENETYSPERYAPLAYLLDPSELDFLAEQLGATTKDLAAFRKERRQIFRMFVSELAADFSALHAEARQLVATEPEAHPELVELLLRQQGRFWGSLVEVEWQLTCEALLGDTQMGRWVGWETVNPAKLLKVAEALHQALVQATFVPGPVPVS
jgi:hypothetical protein